MTAVMGIVNVTPDSFSDAGKHFNPEAALCCAAEMRECGAAIVDFGAESTRPGFSPVAPEEEISRLERIFSSAKSLLNGVDLSVDTRHPETAQAAVEAGFTWVNCVDEAAARNMAQICEKTGTRLVIPSSAWTNDAELRSSIAEELVYIDPMIGFGTTREQDIALFRSIGELSRIRPVLVGISRKRVLGFITGEADPAKRDAASIAAALLAAQKGAAIVRVHDVYGTCQALKTMEALS